MFLGFDLSTQQLKVVVVAGNLNPLKCYSVDFDRDLPSYNTSHGVYKDGSRIIAPVAMWLEALDMILAQMVNDKFDLSKVKALCGSCQQHGSVCWAKKGEALLNDLDSSKSLKDQLSPQAFSSDMSPNWQDHSTVDECKFFGDFVGGQDKLAQISGSRAHHRFTGPQIRKFIKDTPEKYSKTAKITLVSNFLSSVLMGTLVPIDEADATGMNLYDIEKRSWNENLLKATVSGLNASVPDLVSKIGDNVTPVGHESLGVISKYFVEKYGLNPECKVYPFTGDNLATILSLPLQNSDLLVSLGTSTTLLLITDVYKPNQDYHIMIHPTNPKLYMYMICYSNGALPRNSIRDLINAKYGIKGDSWDKFNEILDGKRYQASGDGNIGVYFPQGEIIPNVDFPVMKKYSFDTSSGELLKPIDRYENEETDVKGIVESQALSCRLRVQELLKDSPTKMPHKLFFVGGSSRNMSIITKFSEILGSVAGNYRSLEPNGCAMGGAYKAAWSFEYESKHKEIDYEEYLEKMFDWENLSQFKCSDSWESYDVAVKALQNLESEL